MTGTLPLPAVGVVGICGSVGWGGGIGLAVAESGVPACIPLSKLCIKSAGVTGWTGLAGAVGAAPAAPVSGDTEDAGMCEPPPGAPTPGLGIIGAPGTRGDVAGAGGAGVGLGGAVPPRLLVRRAVGVDGRGWPSGIAAFGFGAAPRLPVRLAVPVAGGWEPGCAGCGPGAVPALPVRFFVEPRVTASRTLSGRAAS